MSAMELSEWEGKLNEEVRIDCTLEALAPGQLIDCAGGEEKGNATMSNARKYLTENRPTIIGWHRGVE